jgi:hypothetical protein
MFHLSIVPFFVFFDAFLIISRKLIGVPKSLVGHEVYRYLARPLRSAWAGELPLFQLIQARYLTRMFLYYHARENITVLRNATNRRYLEVLARGYKTTAIEEAENLKKAYELFENITAYHSRIIT